MLVVVVPSYQHSFVSRASRFSSGSTPSSVCMPSLSVQEKFIGDRGVLLDAATKAGLPADQAAALLDDPQVRVP